MLASGTLYDPQTWNRYAYTLNNPLKYTDPFGLYVWSRSLGGSAKDKDVSEEIRNKRNAFRNALARAKEVRAGLDSKSKEYKKLDRALNAYGEEGVDNNVRITAEDRDKGQEQVNFIEQRRGGPQGELLRRIINVSIDNNAFADDMFAVTVGHAGVHVADAADYINSGYSDSKNPTLYQGEFEAYTVSSVLARGLGFDSLPIYQEDSIDIWNKGWSEQKRATEREIGLKRDNAINKVLARSTGEGGLYGVTSKSQERLFPKF